MSEKNTKPWYIYITEYYSAQRKKKELLPFATVWMDLDTVMLGEISQSVKDIPYDVTYKRNLMNKTN